MQHAPQLDTRYGRNGRHPRHPTPPSDQPPAVGSAQSRKSVHLARPHGPRSRVGHRPHAPKSMAALNSHPRPRASRWRRRRRESHQSQCGRRGHQQQGWRGHCGPFFAARTIRLTPSRRLDRDCVTQSRRRPRAAPRRWRRLASGQRASLSLRPMRNAARACERATRTSVCVRGGACVLR